MSEPVNDDPDLVAKPLESLSAVLTWKAAENSHLITASIPLGKRNVHSANQPRTLICHDMKGGYLEDRFVQGGTDADSYRFFHWSHVDIYVYFSHSFLTIPPPGWIDSAHLHGVPVLGTLITESEGGANICRDLLAGKDPYLIGNFIDKLVEIAQHYQFEGWLINIENPIEAEYVRNLQNFLYWLTVKMREAISNSYVIWYDSVTVNGELKWQDELNALNKVYFDACDGIYLNYNWNDEKLSNSIRQCGQRLSDVYVGIDVFGRGTLGGGGFNSDIAFKAVRNAGLSVALFAPGWVHEVLGPETFTHNEYKFWSLLTDFNPVHGPSELPFSSSFCQGFGRAIYRYGKLLQSNYWCNLSMQQYQPTEHSFYSRETTPHRLTISNSTAYNGGGCLKIKGDPSMQPIPLFRLLTSEFELKVSLLVTYTFKLVSPEDGPEMGLLLTIGDKSEQVKAELLLANDDKVVPPVLPQKQLVTVMAPIGKHLLPDLLRQGIKVPRKHENGWITRCYLLSPDYEDAFIKKVSLWVNANQQKYEILFGQLQLLPMHLLLERHELSVSVAHLAISRISSADLMGITCIIRWSGEHKQLLNHYDIYCRLIWNENGVEKSVTKFVNSTRRSAYKLNEFQMTYPPTQGKFTIRFLIQEHCAGLVVPYLDRVPFAQVKFS
ncbi:hypothetical protein CHUAL_003120 [Chamberlinius hualienensis]